MRQIIAAIISRRRQQDDERRFLVEWQTRTLAAFVGATAFGGGDKLVAAAERISLFPKAKDEEADTSNEPKRGSFERFGALMGKVVMPPQAPLPETREDVHEHGGSPEAGTPDD